jgi:hypothetical protein
MRQGLLLLALAVACSDAAAQLHASPITGPAVYELEGYSVAAPQGKNWFEMRRDKQQALFGKRIESPTHSFAAAATSGVIAEKFERPEQFQEYVDKMRGGSTALGYKVIDYNSELETSFPAWCVRYRLRSEDRDAPHAKGRVLLKEDYGVTCLHPALPGLIVDVGYSERGRPAEISAELQAEGEAFLRSLKFTPRRP